MNIATPGLLVVDLQPAYSRSTGQNSHISRNLMQSVLRHIAGLPADAPLLALYVNEELSGDTFEDVQAFWAERGASDELLERIQWTDKSYAFLRGWMDNGIDQDELCSVLRVLRARNVWDSRNLTIEDIEVHSEKGAELCDPLFRDHDVEAMLPKLTGRDWATCGGARDECLLEVELVLQSADTVFERLHYLTY